MSSSEDGKPNISIDLKKYTRTHQEMMDDLYKEINKSDQPEYQMSQEDLPESTLSTRIDEILWSDCDNCRQIRFGIAIGAIGISLINLISIIALVLWLT